MDIVFRREVLECSFLDPRREFTLVTEKPQIRYDPLTGRSSRIAHLGVVKAQRLNPAQYDSPEIRARCPFCPENRERLTPKFPPGILPAGRLARGEALVVPNIAPYDAVSGLAIMTLNHAVPLEEWTRERLLNAFELGIEFLRIVSCKDQQFPYFLVCWNYMPPSGGGLVHPHLQLFATRHPGNLYLDELSASRRYWEKSGRSFWVDLITAEARTGERYVGVTGSVHWLVPFAPLGLLGDLLAVFPDVYSLEEMREHHLHDLVDGILRLFNFYRERDVQSFNASLVFGPAGQRFFASHFRIIPRTFLNLREYPPDANFFQMLLQEAISVTLPEEMARHLQPHFATG